MTTLHQDPAPGARRVWHAGDRVGFRLQVSGSVAGTAWLRTNLGAAAIRRREIIAHAETGQPELSADWHDFAMTECGDGVYEITLPALEVGAFSAKCFFLPEGQTEPIWPDGDNTRLKVEPSDYVAACSIYSAFVRQFGKNAHHTRPDAHELPAATDLESRDYAVIPPSGTFRDLIGELDLICTQMGFRIIQLLPIFPTPTTYGRMGRFGSPFAALDFLDVDPALADFDRKTTPLQQFVELTDAVHARGSKLFIDIPINHTGWASWLQNHHPEWFARNHDRSFQSPGAWGVTWEDLSKLDYADRDLWQYIADVFLFWCRKGVDGFRCDAGYKVPLPVWTYVVARVRDEYPDVIFLLEGLGGKLEVTEALLESGGLNWAYSELFQTYERGNIEGYIPYSHGVSRDKGLQVHFAETHDNNRLAAASPNYARLRVHLSALLSDAGAFGITSGVEWFAEEKIDVHETRSMNWGVGPGMVDELATLNHIVAQHPAFGPGVDVRMVASSEGPHVLALRGAGEDAAIVAVNLSPDHPTHVNWAAVDTPFPADAVVDLLNGETVSIEAGDGRHALTLAPGGAFCLVHATRAHLDLRPHHSPIPDRVRWQRMRCRAQEIRVRERGLEDVVSVDVDVLARDLAHDPRRFCVEASTRAAPALTTWTFPADARRDVIVPAHHALFVHAPYPFSVEVWDGDAVLRRDDSLRDEQGEHFAVLAAPGGDARDLEIRLVAYEGHTVHRSMSTLQVPGELRDLETATTRPGSETRSHNLYALATNGRGAMSQVRGEWGTVATQYDAILAANLHPDCPSDRHMMFTRCRAWLVLRGYSQELDADKLLAFGCGEDGRPRWHFRVPCGMGFQVDLEIALKLIDGENRVNLHFRRLETPGLANRLPADTPIRLILRPDIEDRNFHSKTKAYQGPEAAWASAVQAEPAAFVFRPAADRELTLAVPGGAFHYEPEWVYGVSHPVDAQRGLGPHSDLYSPGYFAAMLGAGEVVGLSAAVGIPATLEDAAPAAAFAELHREAMAPVLARSTQDYIVKRDDTRTVIAGYPWFLDWGRDTLICMRGIVAAGLYDEALDILIQFARFEQRGTLPNMIRGEDDSNRDTSDAPLWFFTACADLAAVRGDSIYATDCGGRSLLEVLTSIVMHYRDGTPNGIRMDAESGLIFSPSHYTWMDTNHPAGTPREGYPIEIQALWYAALRVLDGQVEGDEWAHLAERVSASIGTYYVREGQGYLSDCLHAGSPVPPAQVEADDALRPNQLLAVTLGAVQDAELVAGILAATESLLVPGGIRSLGDRPVHPPLPVYRDGQLLNDPDHPYWGGYAGDEDTRRKPAYHNGTAWTWQFPLWSEAYWMRYGEAGRDTAAAVLASSMRLLERGCIGQIPEILDGDAPHAQRGCGAQAWGVTELYRVMQLLA